MDEVARELCGTASCTERQRKCVRVCKAVLAWWASGCLRNNATYSGSRPSPPKTPTKKYRYYRNTYNSTKTGRITKYLLLKQFLKILAKLYT
jgi:hypothetical protein